APARRHCRGASGTGRELEAARLNRLLAGYGRRPLPGLGDGRSSDTGDVPRRAARREQPPLSILFPGRPPIRVRGAGGGRGKSVQALPWLARLQSTHPTVVRERIERRLRVSGTSALRSAGNGEGAAVPRPAPLKV